VSRCDEDGSCTASCESIDAHAAWIDGNPRCRQACGPDVSTLIRMAWILDRDSPHAAVPQDAAHQTNALGGTAGERHAIRSSHGRAGTVQVAG
jgi:hypothetical protein